MTFTGHRGDGTPPPHEAGTANSEGGTSDGGRDTHDTLGQVEPRREARPPAAADGPRGQRPQEGGDQRSDTPRFAASLRSEPLLVAGAAPVSRIKAFKRTKGSLSSAATRPKRDSEAKALCRDYINSRLNRAGIGWSKPDQNFSGSGGSLREVSFVLLWLVVPNEDPPPPPFVCVCTFPTWFVLFEWLGGGAACRAGLCQHCRLLICAGITWGKVVSLYAVAGALAVDCVRHGHPAMVHTIVDCLGEFVRKSLVAWLKKRGGWLDITKCVVNTDPSFCSHWLVSAACTCGHFLKAVIFYLLRER
ncbi:hypothetical protein Z043-103201 [Arapaima gigas]